MKTDLNLKAEQRVFLGETEAQEICLITVTGTSLAYTQEQIDRVASDACMQAAKMATRNMAKAEAEAM